MEEPRITIIEDSHDEQERIKNILQKILYNDDGAKTVTSEQQKMTEKTIGYFHTPKKTNPVQREAIELERSSHISFLKNGLGKLGSGHQCLDASQPWIIYWILNSLDLLNCIPDQYQSIINPDNIPQSTFSDIVKFLKKSVDPKCGGYAGGPRQLSHLAPTYASINALAIIGTEEALNSIDRKQVYDFLLSMKSDCGGFYMHMDGELDIRSTYCALNTAYLLNILDDKLLQNVDTFLQSCQTYEGGIGAEPFNEAHGGYTFCGLAVSILAKCPHVLNLPALLRWAVSQQKGYEGGFQGRTNKLVDSCYSFWQGAVFPMLHELLHRPTLPQRAQPSNGSSPFDDSLSYSSWLCNQRCLQDYILLCCQVNEGGFRDKPSKSRDFYHSCYSLNGLSIVQHNADSLPPTVVGKASNLLNRVNPLHGIRVEKADRIREYFADKPL